MLLSYQVGYPGWKLFAQMGVPLRIRVYYKYDEEAKVFCAASNDFAPRHAFAVEASTWEDLQKEVLYAIEEAFEIVFQKDVKESQLKPVYVPA